MQNEMGLILQRTAVFIGVAGISVGLNLTALDVSASLIRPMRSPREIPMGRTVHSLEDTGQFIMG